jgi:hypothetical protein
MRLGVAKSGVLTILIGLTLSTYAAGAGVPDLKQIVPGKTIKHPDYVGQTIGEPKKSLAMAITAESGAGRPQEGLFEAKQVTTVCVNPPDDQFVIPLPTIPIYFHADGTAFSGSSYRHTDAGDELTVLIRGELTSKGRKAKGTIVVQSHTNGTYCSSTDKIWSAKRVAR